MLVPGISARNKSDLGNRIIGHKKEIPFWTPHIIYKEAILVGAKQVRQKQLINGGITILGDIFSPHREASNRGRKYNKFPNDTCKKAYEKLVTNLDLSKASVCSSMQKRKISVHLGALIDGSHIWRFEIHGWDLNDRFRMGNIISAPEKTFVLQHNWLLPTEALVLPLDTQLYRIIVGNP